MQDTNKRYTDLAGDKAKEPLIEKADFSHPDIHARVKQVFFGESPVTCQQDVAARIGDLAAAIAADGWEQTAKLTAKFLKPGQISMTGSWKRTAKK